MRDSCLVLLAAVVVATAAGGPAPAYEGCVVDVFDASRRAMPHSLFLDDAMTPSWCVSACARVRQPLAGLQYGNECWCGGEDYARHGRAADDAAECAMPCAGDESARCGGELRLSVYRVPREEAEAAAAAAASSTPDGSGSNAASRPLLALVMIVKDEAHTLRRTLMPLRPFIDQYFVLDTGSTDGTQDLVRDVLGEDLGEVWEEPFVDYGTSRNRVLEIAQRSARPPVFCLTLSADETVYNAGALRAFLEERRLSEGPENEAYALRMDVGWMFDSVRVTRTDASWRFVGSVHEYLAPPDRSARTAQRVPGAYVVFKATDEERRGQREHKILEILLRDREADPNNTRTSFYLARTYNAVGNHSAALAEYERRVALGGWREEVYESLYAMAAQLKELGRPWSEQQQQLIEAHLHSPGRAEPLYDIADHYLVRGEFSVAFAFALRASQLPFPEDAALWVQAEVYSWQARFVLAQSGVQDSVRQLDIGARALAEALRVKPDNVYLRAREKEYRAAMGDEAVDAFFDAAGAAPGGGGGGVGGGGGGGGEAAPEPVTSSAPSPPPAPPAAHSPVTVGAAAFGGVVVGGLACLALATLFGNGVGGGVRRKTE